MKFTSGSNETKGLKKKYCDYQTSTGKYKYLFALDKNICCLGK
jgi:hypothetical protein